MADRGFQVSLVLKPELRDRYQRAMVIERREERADLLRIIIEDWLTEFERKHDLKPAAPVSKRGSR